MFVISYWIRSEKEAPVRKGMLAWRSTPTATSALGGFEPPPTAARPGEKITTVETDDYQRTVKGWIHPNDLFEVNGTADVTTVVQLDRDVIV